MAGEPGQWWPDKLKYLEANYERCKLKVRQNSLYCKLFILEHQTQLEEERRITAKYEIKAVREQLKQAEVCMLVDSICKVLFILTLFSNLAILFTESI